MKTRMFLAGLMAGLLATNSLVLAVQVDGYCYLEGQPHHDATRVFFQADSPTALTDSTFTDASGYYTIDLLPGIYDIYYSQGWFMQSAFYNQLVSEAITLPEVTLLDASGAEYLSGSLSGTLNNSMYIVQGDVTVNGGDSLIIEPGVRLYFYGGEYDSYVFRIEGYLSAMGSAGDSIKFMPAPDTYGWGGIYFYEAMDTCQLQYCLITGSTSRAIICNDCNPTFLHCNIVGNTDSGGGAGMYLHESNPILSYCIISNNTSINHGGGGIRCLGNSSPTLIQCILSDNSAAEYGGGISIWGSCFAIFDHCLIYGNTAGEDGGGIWCGQLCDMSIIHCTISNNSAMGQGSAVYNYDRSNLELVNSIIQGNSGESAVYVEDSYYSTFSITFNDFYSNSGDLFAGSGVPEYLGQVITVNANNDPCDAYMNIFLDPQFVDPINGNYHLLGESPCIDAGDPSSPLDPDGTIADIGAFYYNQLGVEGEQSAPQPVTFQLLQNYPNPFNPITTLGYELPTTAHVNFSVYDLLGRQVAILKDNVEQAGTHQMTFDGSQLPSGIYFYQLQTGDFTETRKMLLIK